MEYYKVMCNYGYSVLNEAPPKLDASVLYTIFGKSKYYRGCVLIERADKKEYLGNNTWIVPEEALVLILS